MNDVEIKDIDKLKNLLIEFGVEFEQDNFERTSYVNVPVEGENFDYCFEFNSTGKFVSVG